MTNVAMRILMLLAAMCFAMPAFAGGMNQAQIKGWQVKKSATDTVFTCSKPQCPYFAVITHRSKTIGASQARSIANMKAKDDALVHRLMRNMLRGMTLIGPMKIDVTDYSRTRQKGLPGYKFDITGNFTHRGRKIDLNGNLYILVNNKIIDYIAVMALNRRDAGRAAALAIRAFNP